MKKWMVVLMVLIGMRGKFRIISFIICFMTLFSACNSNNKAEQKTEDKNRIDTDINNSFDQQPIKTVYEFMKWYKINQPAISKIDMVNPLWNEPVFDSAKFYHVDFIGTEKY